MGIVGQSIDKIPDFDSLSQKEQVKLISYFYCSENKVEEFSSMEIRRCFENENLSKPANVTHELNKLSSQKPAILNRNEKNGTYSFHRTAKRELDSIYLSSQDTQATKTKVVTELKESAYIGVITASPDEFNTIKSLLTDVKVHEAGDNDSITYYTGFLKENGKQFSVVLPYPLDMGISPAVISTTKVIANFSPQYLFMVGIAAGNKKINNIGDILIAEKSLDYNEVVEGEKKDRSPTKKLMQAPDSINKHLKTQLSQFRDSAFVQQIGDGYEAKAKIKTPLKCSLGLLVTGSSLMRSQVRVEEINETYVNVIGLDMETRGFYFASAHTLKRGQPYFVSIKSVSDFGDNSDHGLSALERRKYALYTSSNAFRSFVLNYIP